jgi:L-alanine-DL-glutamate epimerase-like enolase superfamily enzyme
MKITKLTPRVLTRRFEQPQRNPFMTLHEKNTLLVLLETDTGLLGVGEAWCEGLSPSSTVALLEEDLRPLVLGEDPFYSARIWNRICRTTIISAKRGSIYSALSAIDIAIWDLLGKALGQPVYKLLGGCSDRVFAYASAGLYGAAKTPDDLAREMLGYVESGFRAIKIKIGGASLAEDIRRVAAVREAVGPDIRLMVDAVYSLTVPQAIRLARAMAPYDIHFFEAPVSPYDVTGLKRVASESPVPMGGNEVTVGRTSFRDLITNEAVSCVHLDTILCGGISESMKIASLADAWGLSCSFHMASSAVCLAANMHVAAAIPNIDSVECHMLHQTLFEALPAGTLDLVDGCALVPQGPGLGLEFDLRNL